MQEHAEVTGKQGDLKASYAMENAMEAHAQKETTMVNDAYCTTTICHDSKHWNSNV